MLRPHLYSPSMVDVLCLWTQASTLLFKQLGKPYWFPPHHHPPAFFLTGDLLRVSRDPRFLGAGGYLNARPCLERTDVTTYGCFFPLRYF